MYRGYYYIIERQTINKNGKHRENNKKKTTQKGEKIMKRKAFAATIAALTLTVGTGTAIGGVYAVSHMNDKNAVVTYADNSKSNKVNSLIAEAVKEDSKTAELAVQKALAEAQAAKAEAEKAAAEAQTAQAQLAQAQVELQTAQTAAAQAQSEQAKAEAQARSEAAQAKAVQSQAAAESAQARAAEQNTKSQAAQVKAEQAKVNAEQKKAPESKKAEVKAPVKKNETKKAETKKSETVSPIGTATIAATDFTAYVVNGVNVRGESNPNGKVLFDIGNGTKVNVKGVVTKNGKSTGWVQIEINGNTYYVYAEYLTTNAPKSASAIKESEKNTAAMEKTEKKVAPTIVNRTPASDVVTPAHKNDDTSAGKAVANEILGKGERKQLAAAETIETASLPEASVAAPEAMVTEIPETEAIVESEAIVVSPEKNVPVVDAATPEKVEVQTEVVSNGDAAQVIANETAPQENVQTPENEDVSENVQEEVQNNESAENTESVENVEEAVEAGNNEENISVSDSVSVTSEDGQKVVLHKNENGCYVDENGMVYAQNEDGTWVSGKTSDDSTVNKVKNTNTCSYSYQN